MSSTSVFYYLATLSILLSAAYSLSLPGIRPVGYTPGQVLGIRVSSLTSNLGILPYDFYEIKTCKPSPKRLKEEKKHENLGEILLGTHNEPSEYYVEVLRNFTCRKVCDTVTYTEKEMKTLEKRINEQYRGNMVLDGLPVAQEVMRERGPKVMLGYPLGVPAKYTMRNKAVINNHLHFRIFFNEPDVYNENNEETFRIVGFQVTAHSINYQEPNVECDPTKPFRPEIHSFVATDGSEVTYTYSVTWLPQAEVLWATRWDVYLKSSDSDTKVHWFSIVNASIVVCGLAAVIALIVIRALRKDFIRYNEALTAEEAQEESGWKLVHGDVFRPPEFPVALSILVGSGIQVYFMSAGTLAIALTGLLNPQTRGALVTALIMCYVLVSFFGGYTGAVLLKFFKRQAWKNAFAVALFLPGTTMLTYIMLNFVHWAKHASSAIPFTTLLVILALLMCCSVPQSIVGAHFGFRRDVLTVPTRVNVIPRLIPATKGMPSWLPIVIGAALPFGAAFIELLYILSSVWQGRVYYVFGFLTVVFFIVSLCTAESAIAATYLRLCYENYNWWWSSFALGAGTGVYVYVYSLYYLLVALPIRQPTSLLLYLGYMGMGSALLSVMLGSIAFVASFIFIRKIYTAIKID